eukprot:IDg8913t1
MEECPVRLSAGALELRRGLSVSDKVIVVVIEPDDRAFCSAACDIDFVAEGDYFAIDCGSNDSFGLVRLEVDLNVVIKLVREERDVSELRTEVMIVR